MFTKKIFIVLIAGLTVAAAGIGTMGIAAMADETPAAKMQFVTQVTDADNCFTYSDDGSAITGFTVPQSVTGYFEVVIPDTVQRINGGAFDATGNPEMMNHFIAIEIPESVNSIYAGAFENCNNLLEVCISESLAEGTGSNFTSATSIVYSAADKTLKTVSDDNGDYLFVRNGDAESKEYILVDYEGDAEKLTLPQASIYAGCTTYSIYDHAFSGNTKLTSLVLPACVTSIGTYAFNDCESMKEVTLSEGLKTIEDYAFAKSAIEAIEIPKSVTDIKEHAFDSCTSMTSLTFAGKRSKTETLTIDTFAFSGCLAIRVLYLPDNTTVRQFAFNSCTALIWVYVGENTVFNNTAKTDYPDAVFFPKRPSPTIVFPSLDAYNAMLNQSDETFKNNNGSAATYIVQIRYHIGSSSDPVVYERLHGYGYNYVGDSETGYWNTDSAHKTLLAQDNYASTVWYSDKDALKTTVSVDQINTWLLDGTKGTIDLYCHETVAPLTQPQEAATWAYKSKISYDISDKAQILAAVGCEQSFTLAQLDALDITVAFQEENGNIAETPDKINSVGTYTVTVSLKSDYGSWKNPVIYTVTITADTSGFNAVLIVLIVLGVLAVGVTISTAIIRKKVQSRNKKKQLTQKEILEKFRASGGETHLQ